MTHTRSYRVFNAVLRRTEDISPHLRRVTFGSDELFHVTTWAPDQRIKIFFPSPDGRPPAIEDREDWYAVYKSVPVSERAPMRTYTIRHVRPEVGEMDVDFVLHGENGPASRWATRAVAGNSVQINAPNLHASQRGGGFEWQPPVGVGNVLLLADETALPALAGILEELADLASPPAVEAYVEVPAQGDCIELPHWPGLNLNWLVREDRPGEVRPGSLLVEAVQQARLPEGASENTSSELEAINIDEVVPWERASLKESNFYAWIAGESEAVMAIRKFLIKERGLDRRTLNLMGYWRYGKVFE